MQKKYRLSIAWLILSLLLGACSSLSNGKNVATAYILWKSPSLKFADQAFIYDENDSVVMEIYSSAAAIGKLKITPQKVCKSLLCQSASSFNEEFLCAYYPPNTLFSIVKGREIFAGMGKKSVEGGFVQKVTLESKYDIEYRVLNSEVNFRDKINDITIKIEKMDRAR
jgi:hypothetical protein